MMECPACHRTLVPSRLPAFPVDVEDDRVDDTVVVIDPVMGSMAYLPRVAAIIGNPPYNANL